MGKNIIAFILVLTLGLSQALARENKRQDFENNRNPVVYKGEHVVGLSVGYTNLSSANSDIMLIISDLGAKAALFNASAGYFYAYAKNQTIGIRGSYSNMDGGLDNVNMNLLSETLAIDVQDLHGKTWSYGAGLFHRSFLGLDKKGNVGLYLEAALRYKYSNTRLGSLSTTAYTIGNQARLSLAPGVILYILPNVSLSAQIGIANVSYNNSTLYDGGERIGSIDKWAAAMKFNLQDLMVGINLHF